jgi:hypothetical protein
MGLKMMAAVDRVELLSISTASRQEATIAINFSDVETITISA